MRTSPRFCLTIALAVLLTACQLRAAENDKGPELQVETTTAPREGVANFTSLEKKLCLAHTPGHWWVGTLGGLARLDDKTFQLQRVYTSADGLAGTPVTALAAEGNLLWVGTHGGLSELDAESGTLRTIRVPGYYWRFEADEAAGLMWALAEGTVVRFGRSLQGARVFSLAERQADLVRDNQTLWAIAFVVGDQYRVTRLDTATGGIQTGTFESPDTSGLPRLLVATDHVWALARSTDLRRGCRLYRIDKTSIEVTAQTPALGLAHEFVEDLTTVGSDVWVRTTGDYDRRAHVGIGGKLCRLDRRTGRWQTFDSISGRKHDQPTCLSVLDGNLWVATRAYDAMKKMVVGWGMMPIEAEAPSLSALTLNRLLPETGKWRTIRLEAETDFDRILDMTLIGNRLWFLLDRKPVAQSYEQMTDGSRRLGLFVGYVDLTSPGAKPVLDEKSPLAVAPRDRWRGRNPAHLVTAAGTVWVQRMDELWRRTADGAWSPLELTGRLPDSWEKMLFAVGGNTFLSCATGAFRYDNESQRWVPWGDHSPWGVTHVVQQSGRSWEVHSPWRITHVIKDPQGTWWTSAVTSRIGLPADSERTDDDRKPLQAGLFRKSDGATWQVPSIAPWTWHQSGVEGEVRFLPIEEVQRTPRDLDLWGQTAMDGPRRGVRREMQAKDGEGVSCVQSDGQRIWVGTFGDGVFCLEKSRWRRLWPKSPKPADHRSYFVPRAPEDTIVGMVLDGESIWIATMADLRRCRLSDGTIEKVDRQAVGIKPVTHSLDYGYGWRLLCYGPPLAKAAGRIWFSPRGTQQTTGVYCLSDDGTTWKCVIPDGLASSFAGSGHLVWIGTQEGLLRYHTDTGRQKRFTTRDGLTADQILSVAVDDRFVWAATPTGVSRLDRSLFENGNMPAE